MAAPQNEYAFDLGAAKAAAERWATREQQHARFDKAVRDKRYSELDTPVRRAARANRLIGKLQYAAPAVAESMTSEFDESTGREIAQCAVTPETVSDVLLERVIGTTRDFLFVGFLEQALLATRSVGRVVTQLGGGRFSYGTGFLVSSRLLLTNHHVLDSAEIAGRSTIEFDYQRDRLGKEIPVRAFRLDPQTFFLNDQALDFALVAVAPDDAGRPLRDYGWCPLIKETGKIVAGEPINIIQHPKGEMKQIVMRENRLIDAFDGDELFLQYEADTEPGSSGSPVFNDQWEVVALHHTAVPKRNSRGDLLDVDGRVWKNGDDPSRIQWVANEGVRVSKLVAFISEARVKPSAKDLVKELIDAKSAWGSGDGPPVDPPRPRIVSTPEPPSNEDRMTIGGEGQDSNNSVTLTVPLQITVRIGAPRAGRADELDNVTVDVSDAEKEKIVPDPGDTKYAHRPGYQPDFLGFEVPFPTLTNAIRKKAFALPSANGDDKFLLKYHHFSVLFNKARKLAFAAGVNFDPTARFQHERDKDGDRWFFDPRVGPKGENQAGDDLYARNPLDRGHLVRRADAAWGRTAAEAKLANDDTFHFTNCSPQHAITNQGLIKQAPKGLKLWGKLEDHVASQGKRDKRKLCVFNGPVFRPSDPEYRKVQLPREFWKVVVFENDEGEEAAVAFVLTQADLIQDLREEFEVGEYKAVQVRMKDLEAKTNLDFGPFRTWDVLERPGADESFTGDVPAVVLESVTDVVL